MILDFANRGFPLKEGFRLDEAVDDYEVTTVSFFDYLSTITLFMSIAEVDSDSWRIIWNT